MLPEEVKGLVIVGGVKAVIDQALAGELVAVPVFSNIDSQVEGTLVKLCPGSCSGGRVPASAK